MTPRRTGQTLVVITVVEVLLAFLIPAVQAGWEAIHRSHCVGNLKMIVLAVHTYHEVFGCCRMTTTPSARADAPPDPS